MVGLDWQAVALLLEVEAPGPEQAAYRATVIDLCRCAEPAAVAGLLKAMKTTQGSGDAP